VSISLCVSYLYRMRDLRRASVISMRSLFGTTPAAELSFSSSRLRILPAIASLICSSLLLPAASKQCRKSLHPCTHQRTHARTHAQTRIHATPPGRILFQFRARKCPGVGQRHHGTEDNSQSTRSRHCVGLGIGRFSVRFHTGVQRECKAQVT
jgi:hypothetical protein